MLPNKSSFNYKYPDDDVDTSKLDILFTEFKIIMQTVRELSDEEFKAFNKRLMAS